MHFDLLTVSMSLGLLAGMIAFSELGRRFGRRRGARDPEGAWQGVSVIDGAVFGLLGLIVAFTFSGASARLDVRRNLIVQEVNAIGTAYLRLDLLPASAQPALRESFRNYVDARIRVYESFPDVSVVRAGLETAASMQPTIWSSALTAATQSHSATILLLPALNDMFDVANTRTLSALMHPPSIIYVMLFTLALGSATLAGYGMARSESPSWLHIVVYAAVAAAAFFVILDIEHPRLGVIKINALDTAFRDLRSSMN